MLRGSQYQLAEQARKEAERKLLRERLELHAKTSRWHKAQLAILLREEAEEAELEDLRRQRQFEEEAYLHEAGWNPALHPRAGTAPNRGYFAPTGGGGGQAGHGGPFTLPSYTGPQQVHAEPVGLPAVGHHYVAVGAVMDSKIRPLLSDSAVHYALGNYSGPTDPSHNSRGVKRNNTPRL